MHKQKKEIYFGNTVDNKINKEVKGQFVKMQGEVYYQIKNYDEMPPFFMSIVSDADHWLFISSTGGLTAGRINANSALFPYYTEDKVEENIDNTGSKTILQITKNSKIFSWEPFSFRYSGIYQIQRNIYKNTIGNKLIFEEINLDLKLTYQSIWRTSDKYGFVKSSVLKNDNNVAVSVDVLDGFQNIMPFGPSADMQVGASNLLDAYKRCELDKESGLGFFGLSSTLTDMAEPSESLKTTTIWQVGLDNEKYLLSSVQLDDFRHGLEIEEEYDVKGKRGSFLVNSKIELAANKEKDWNFIAELNQDSSKVAKLINELKTKKIELMSVISEDIERGSQNLLGIIGSADGLQVSGDNLSSVHHFANVLFNTMRGGIFAKNYKLQKGDLIDFIATRNVEVLEAQKDYLSNLPEEIDFSSLIEKAAGSDSTDFIRLCYEYLPLTFSRRHGDPSRPWNKFSINIKKEDGSKKLDYQGNWRDIFQNWEPLAFSFPEFLEGMISKFLNATTADGYNPYRVTRQGIEWEKPEEGSEWSNIGYWSDHQIIYLQKLIEVSEKFHPGILKGFLSRQIFSHANVPYKLKSYESILADHYDTIEFDHPKDEKIEEIAARLGSDGKLLFSSDGKIFHVNMMEKLLILFLAKMVNFIPEGGIWMNTQRPEWNDGNNALVGKGISMVTTCYMRRFVVSCIDILKNCDQTSFSLSKDLKNLFSSVKNVLEQFENLLNSSFNDTDRKKIMDGLGKAGSDYRTKYNEGRLSFDFDELNKDNIISLLETALKYIEHTIKANKRSDNLYHSYNILHVRENTASVDHLYEMLEGQVAILSSGMLSSQETIDLLDALRSSRIYRADQHSYMLYPDKELKGFLNKNCVDADLVKDSKLIAKLIENNDISLISKDENGVYHFNGNFRNVKNVQTALNNLKKNEAYSALVEEESKLVEDIFEKIFDHSSFTGRSGTFFAYEGLGSIYWHMVSKLLLAAQEAHVKAVSNGEDSTVIKKLADKYYDIRNGIGFNKTPEVYGAFPTDPYSHTPWGKGAKQPGMTGQVKEEVLTRLIEMGLFVDNGSISFNPILLREKEFLKDNQVFEYFDVSGEKQQINLSPGSLAYTFCQIPVIYVSSSSVKIEIEYADGKIDSKESNVIDADTCKHIFVRDGQIKQIKVYTKASL